MEPITAGLSSEQKQSLRFLSESRTIGPGALVFKAGDPADGFYQVMAGEIELFSREPDGSEVRTALMRDGDIFGFAGALPGAARRLVTARATRLTSLLDLPVDPVEVFQRTYGAGVACVLLRNILEHICRRLVEHVLETGELPTVRPIPRLPNDPLGNPEEWLERLRGVMPSGFFGRLFGAAKWKAGTTVILQGEAVNEFGFLEQGQLAAVMGAGAEARRLWPIDAPGTFGHLSFFGRCPLPFSIVAIEGSSGIMCSRAVFDRFVEEQPEAALKVLDGIMRLLGWKMARMG